MARPKKPTGIPSRRIHYIPEWAAKFGYSQADVSRLAGVDKGTVSRWFDGQIPSEPSLELLKEVFQLEEAGDLFRHPVDDWMARFLRGRSEEERERIRATLETAFPRKSA